MREVSAVLKTAEYLKIHDVGDLRVSAILFPLF